VLREKIQSHAAAFERTSDLDELLRRLDRRRVQLRDKAFVLGTRLFAEKPQAFVDHIGQH